jgi:hypothetical protein
MAVSSLPGTTDLQTPAGLEPGECRDAARCAARFTMLASHGCTGKRCRKKDHKASAESMHLVLSILGLAGEREP